MNTPLIKRAYNLGLKAVPNFIDALSEDQISYYEGHLDELPSAISRGFIIPEQIVQPLVTVAPPILFKVSETDLNWWLDQTQKFAKKYLGVDIDLRKRFAIPEALPGHSVIPVFDPGALTNRDMVKRALKSLKLDVYEEVDVMKYAGSEANAAPTLSFIENSIRPNADTMGLSPDDLRRTGKSYLRLRGYGLAFAVYHFAKGEYLDPETWTWFPEDRLSGGGVANGGWYPGRRRVRFNGDYPGSRGSGGGARVAMPVSLKS